MKKIVVNNFFRLPLSCDIHPQLSPLPKASDEPTSGYIQHMAQAEHNKGAIPSAIVVDADGAMVADVGGTVVVDDDGAMVVDEDAMPIAAVDYWRPMPFVSGGLASWSSHSAPLGVH